MSTFRWKNQKGEQGTIWAEKTAAGVSLQVSPDDDFYAGELTQWQAAELMLHFYSLLKRSPGDKPPEALLMMVREICNNRTSSAQTRSTISERWKQATIENPVPFALGFAEICELLGLEPMP